MQSRHLTITSSKNTHFLQGMCTILSRLESSTGRRRFSTGRCRLSTGNAKFLQEALYFYRKLPVEVRDCPEFILWGDLTTKDRFGRMQATVVTLAHYCYLVPPSLSTCNKVTCTSKADRWVIKEEAIFKVKNAEMSYHIHPSHPWALWAWSWGHCLRRAACTRGGKTVTGHPTGVP